MNVVSPFFFILFCFASIFGHAEDDSIVPPQNQISDFSARLEYAKILSRNSDTLPEAVKQFQILLKEDFKDLVDFSQLANPINEGSLKENDSSIVPSSSWVTEFDARHELARIYSHHRNTYQKALIEYEKLLQKEPQNIEIVIELSQLYSALDDGCSTLQLLYCYLEYYPENVKLLKALAQLEASLSHVNEASSLFNQALDLSQRDTSILESYGDLMMSIASFYKAEEIFRELLSKNPHSLDISLKLAWSLASAQRYEEAEGLYYEFLISWPAEPKIILALARMKILEKDFCQALEFAEILLEQESDNAMYLDLKADILIALRRYCDAINYLHLIVDDKKLGSGAFLRLGKTFLRIGDCEEAYVAFEYALLLDPKNFEAQFYLDGGEIDSCFVESITKIEDLITWAKIFQNNQQPNQAISFYEAVLKMDPNHFSAKMDLAEALGAVYQYEEALSLYQQLIEIDPDNYKVMLSIARIESWSKNYTIAIEHYDDLIALNPNNPVVYREKGRTALWGKKIAIAKQAYEALLCPPVDQLIYDDIFLCAKSGNLETFINGYRPEQFSISLYEELSHWICDNRDSLCDEEIKCLEKILIKHRATYLIQKSLLLEWKAKQLFWNKRFLHSLTAYKDVLELNPGNEEVLFDYAQNYCILGLCDCSRSVYKHFLNLDPNHDLARMALRRIDIKEHFGIQGYVSYWREVGSGTFSQSQIARYRADLIFEQPITCRATLRFRQQTFVENPFYNFKFYPAEGQTLEGDYIFNEHVKWFGSISYKTYFHKFKSVYSSANNLYLKINDYFDVILGCNRENEIYDFFSLKQAIQSINSWITISSNITKYWSVEGTCQYYRYNDHNSQIHYNIKTEYQMTEHPKELKLILEGNYRDSAKQSVFIFNGPTLVNIIHPYWTPDHYFSGYVTLEFRRDYRYFEYCNSPQRYLDLKISAGMDSVNNPSIQGVLEWKYEFENQWGVEVKGLINRSPQWNAEGFWGSIYYRF